MFAFSDQSIVLGRARILRTAVSPWAVGPCARQHVRTPPAQLSPGAPHSHPSHFYAAG